MRGHAQAGKKTIACRAAESTRAQEAAAKSLPNCLRPTMVVTYTCMMGAECYLFVVHCTVILH